MVRDITIFQLLTCLLILLPFCHGRRCGGNDDCPSGQFCQYIPARKASFCYWIRDYGEPCEGLWQCAARLNLQCFSNQQCGCRNNFAWDGSTCKYEGRCVNDGDCSPGYVCYQQKCMLPNEVPKSSDGSLTAGQIVGIVFGTIILFGLVVVLVAFIILKMVRKNDEQRNLVNDENRASRPSSPTNTSQNSTA